MTERYAYCSTVPRTFAQDCRLLLLLPLRTYSLPAMQPRILKPEIPCNFVILEASAYNCGTKNSR